jgi:DNA-binding NtrC family response regulator
LSRSSRLEEKSPSTPERRTHQILIVDDDPSAREAMKLILSTAGNRLRLAETAAEALAAAREDPVELALVDLRLKGSSGIDLLVELKRIRPEMSVVMVTGAGTIETAVEAMKLGADNFLTKPVAPKSLQAIVAKGLETRSLRRRADALERLESGRGGTPLFGGSPKFRRSVELAGSVAERDTTVLLTGETGTGKGLLARWLHDHSPRRRGPFVELNCAGFQRELVESELFGHEKGSFSGAVERKIGLVEAADRGSLLLDEIGEMDAVVQAKLLKVLETKRFRRLGGLAEIEADVRWIVATHRDLPREVEAGRFRQDLLFRLNVFEIPLPPLRERGDDVLALATRFAAEFRGGDDTLAPEAEERLLAYDWPGNIRELRNVLERAAILSHPGEPIGADDLPALSRGRASEPVETADEPDEIPTFREAEKRFLESALRAHAGNVRATARSLGMSRTTLYRKIERYELAGLTTREG